MVKLEQVCMWVLRQQHAHRQTFTASHCPTLMLACVMSPHTCRCDCVSAHPHDLLHSQNFPCGWVLTYCQHNPDMNFQQPVVACTFQTWRVTANNTHAVLAVHPPFIPQRKHIITGKRPATQPQKLKQSHANTPVCEVVPAQPWSKLSVLPHPHMLWSADIEV